MNHDPIPLEELAIRIIINEVKDQLGIPHLEDWYVITQVCLNVAFLEMFRYLVWIWRPLPNYSIVVIHKVGSVKISDMDFNNSSIVDNVMHTK